jgi:hypothetical protein
MPQLQTRSFAAVNSKSTAFLRRVVGVEQQNIYQPTTRANEKLMTITHPKPRDLNNNNKLSLSNMQP